MALWHFLLLILISLLGAEARIITLRNSCNTTIWPGFQEFFQNYTYPSQQFTGNNELASHNYELQPGESVNITTPEDWQGMIWGRHGCSFDSFGFGTCITGDCIGKLQCGGLDFPIPPYTSAAININSTTDDSYWIDLGSGFNFPMSIFPYGYDDSIPCQSSSCLSDINKVCPGDRQVRISDEIVACESDCYATNNYNPEYCCYGANETCTTSSYSTVVNEACPTAVVNRFIWDANTFQCNRANYMVSFC